MKYTFLTFGIAIIAFLFASLAFTEVSNMISAENKAAMNEGATKELAAQMVERGNNLYQKSFTGAILNTEKDTIALPNFLSNYQLQVAATRASVSGTHNVKIYLDESNFLTGTANWRLIDSSSTTTATLTHLRQGVTYGLRHRIRCSGTGTQSSTYVVGVIAKKLN
jgi:hypothetical protein